MNTKEKNLPAVVMDDFDNDFYAPIMPEYNGEFSVGPVSFKRNSKGCDSDNSNSIIDGVLAGGAIAIGAVAVTLTLLNISKNS